MSLFNETVTKQLTDILTHMGDEVSLLFFTQEIECGICRDTHDFIEEIVSLNGKIGLTVYDLLKDKDKAGELGIDKIPAIRLFDKNGGDTRITFYGLPGGYEINSFLGAILEVSGLREPLGAGAAARINAVGKDVHIQVFVTLTCPFCPGAVSAAHRLALESPRVRADMIDSALYPHLVQKYAVQGVPRIIINEKESIEGSQSIENLLDKIEQLQVL